MMSVIYPHCTPADVQDKLQQLPEFSTTTDPTLEDVKEFIQSVSDHIDSVASTAGYDVDNYHESSGTVTDAIAAGSSVEIELGTDEGDNFVEGNIVKLEGTLAGALVVEFQKVESVSNDTLTILTIDSNIDAGCIVKLVNPALYILRKLAATGAAYEVLESISTGLSDDMLAEKDKLLERYNGSETNFYGLWAILKLANFLRGATTGTTAAKLKTMPVTHTSPDWGSDDGEPKFDKDMKF